MEMDVGNKVNFMEYNVIYLLSIADIKNYY